LLKVLLFLLLRRLNKYRTGLKETVSQQQTDKKQPEKCMHPFRVSKIKMQQILSTNSTRCHRVDATLILSLLVQHDFVSKSA